MVILKYLTKEWENSKEEYAKDNPDLMKIYEGNRKFWDFLIISLIDILFGLVS